MSATAHYDRRVRVGLIGCGRWGRHILRDLLDLGCEVPVLARTSDSFDRARAGGATAIVADVAGLGDVDGVVVATPSSTHAEVVAEVLELGVPTFVEKPLASDPDAARDLAARASDSLFVMDKWRYHPGVLELARIARDGTLGEVVALHTVRVGWERPHADVDGVWILAPHDLAIALEILGTVPRPLSAQGFVRDGRASPRRTARGRLRPARARGLGALSRTPALGDAALRGRSGRARRRLGRPRHRVPARRFR